MQQFYPEVRGLSRLLVLVTLIHCTQFVVAQCLPPTSPPTPYCHQAPLVCLQDVCFSTEPGDPNAPHFEPTAWCMTDNPMHDPQYYLFQATENIAQIHIAVNSCHGMGCGLEAVISNACLVGFTPWTAANMVGCDAMACAGETMILAPAVTPGAFYYLLIDTDMENSHCSYTIEFLDGIMLPEIASDLTSASSVDTIVCPGQDNWRAFTQTLPDVQGYYWTGFPWLPNGHVTRFSDMHGNGEPLNIPDNIAPGVYEICVVGVTGCDSTDTPRCFNLHVVDPGGVSEPAYYCAEDFNNGIDWEGLTISNPGTYTQEYMSPEGCPYDSTKQFFEYEPPFEGYFDTVLCGEVLIYEGEEYFNPGTYTLYYEDATSNGCDSFATLQLELAYIEATTSFQCLNGNFILSSTIVSAVPNTTGVTYRWYRNGNLVSTAPSFTSPTPGVFELFIDRYECQFAAITNPITINLQDLVPAEPPVLPYDTITCANQIASYAVTPQLGGIMRFYEWTINPPVPFVVSDTLNSRISVNWQGFTGGTICVNGVNHCGPGPDSCFAITVIPAPTAAFTMQSQACVNDQVTIQFTGVGTPNASYLWNFDGGTVISGGSGPGPHVIAWSAPGNHTVSLQVAEIDCDTSTAIHNIFVENLGTPVLNCVSTLNSITFNWAPVSGAVNYSVNVLQGPSGILSGTTYSVTGLASGTTVEIQVIANGTGACPPTSSTIECIAQSCGPHVIDIQIPDDFFCLGDVTGPVTLTALVDGTPASGNWSGPGVSPGGTFNPLTAGAGIHTIVFMYSEMTCDYQQSIDVEVVASPTSTFTATPVICQASSATVVYTGTASINAAYNWNFGSGVASGSGAGPYTVTWATPGLYTIRLTVTEDGCVADEVTHQVDVQPVITAPTINCFPTTGSVTIQWSNVPGATDYDVEHLFGPMGTVNGNQYVVNGLMPGDSVSIEITVSGNTICPPVTVEASCVAQECPMPVISVDPEDDICLYPGTGNVDLNVTVTGGNGTGVWSGTGIVNPVTGIFDPNLAGEGSHLIQYNYTDSGCSFVESITISVYDVPTANISNTSFILTCDSGGELVLDGSGSAGVNTYLWTTNGGQFIGATNQPTARAVAAGEYTLTVFGPGGCEDEVSVNVSEDTGIPTANAGADGLIDCRVDSAIIGGSSSTGSQFTYAWSASGGGQIFGPTNGLTVIAIAGGTYTITVTDNDNGCTAVDQAIVNTNYATPTGALTVGDILDCDVTQTTITSSINPPGAYVYAWETLDGQIISGNGTSSILVDRAGLYTLVVTSGSNGCTGSVATEVFADPEVIDGIIAEVDYPECPGDRDGMINILDIEGGKEPFEFLWSNNTSGDFQVFLHPGTYTVTVTDANGCTIQETFILPTPQPILGDLGPDLEVAFGDEIELFVNTPDPTVVDDIIWEGIAPSCPGCFINVWDAEETGYVYVTMLDSSGCAEFDTVYIKVDRNRRAFIPNVFSPNGDDVNEVFRISGKLLETIEFMRIYSRWGDQLYGQGPVPATMDIGWDGTFNGRELNPGVYIYQARLIYADGESELVTGTVTLLR